MPDMTDGEWMHLTVHAPTQVINAVLALLQREHDFRDISPIDWCTMERPQDFAHIDYAPAGPGVNQYKIDWRKGEGRGDVVVDLSSRKDREDPA